MLLHNILKLMISYKRKLRQLIASSCNVPYLLCILDSTYVYSPDILDAV